MSPVETTCFVKEPKLMKFSWWGKALSSRGGSNANVKGRVPYFKTI